jgi:hypothetical protein
MGSSAVVPTLTEYLQSIASSGFVIPFKESAFEVSGDGWQEEVNWGSDVHAEPGDALVAFGNMNYQQSAIMTNGSNPYSLQIGSPPSAGENTVTVSANFGSVPSVGEGRTVGVFVRFGYSGSAGDGVHRFAMQANQFQINSSDENSTAQSYIRPTVRGTPVTVACEDLNPSTGARLLLMTNAVDGTGPLTYEHKFYIGSTLEVTESNIEVNDGLCDPASIDITLQNNGRATDPTNPTRHDMYVQDMFVIDHLCTLEEVQYIAANYQ